MTEYGLYLESGPRRQKTMVHMLDLLGCVAVGPTTEAALGATPEAIQAYLRFLNRCGEPVDPDAPFTTRVEEHVAQAGLWLGNGSPYVTYGPDVEPLSEAATEVLLGRFHTLREALASWAESAADEQLDAPFAGSSRTPRAILHHLLGGPGAYLSPILGGSTGYYAVTTATERGELPVVNALRKIREMAIERVRAATPEERSTVRQRPKEVRTLRKALRRLLEHGWEHLAELSRRLGGPVL